MLPASAPSPPPIPPPPTDLRKSLSPSAHKGASWDRGEADGGLWPIWETGCGSVVELAPLAEAAAAAAAAAFDLATSVASATAAAASRLLASTEEYAGSFSGFGAATAEAPPSLLLLLLFSKSEAEEVSHSELRSSELASPYSVVVGWRKVRDSRYCSYPLARPESPRKPALVPPPPLGGVPAAAAAAADDGSGDLLPVPGGATGDTAKGLGDPPLEIFRTVLSRLLVTSSASSSSRDVG